MKVLILDTNVFLQCPPLDQLPWKEISPDDDLLLLIPRPVQEEIDKLKQDGSGRRSERARKASSFFREILRSDKTQITIRDPDPRVEVGFTPSLDRSVKLPEILDTSRADDMIIGEAIAFSYSNPGLYVAILTHDINPLLTAKRCGFPYVEVPGHWLLKPEPDSRDKRINELERKIKNLEKAHPQIEISGSDFTGNLMEELSICVTRYTPPSEKDLAQIIDEVQKRCSLPTYHGKMPGTVPIGLRYEPPSKEKIEEYNDVLYPEWLNKVIKFIQSLPERLERDSYQSEVAFSIYNSGNVSAEGVIVEFRAQGELFLQLPPDDEDTSEEHSELKIPEPPAVPQGRLVRDLSSTSAFDLIKSNRSLYTSIANTLRANNDSLYSSVFDTLKKYNSPSDWVQPMLRPYEKKQRDKQTFYWKPGRPPMPSKIWTFECEEFRHRTEPEIFEMLLLVPSRANSESGALQCRLSAKNLPDPKEFTLPVSIKYAEGNIIEEIRKLMDDQLPPL